MDQSERIERIKENSSYDEDALKADSEFSERIAALLNHPDINKYCMVDAYYYDFSSIPEEVYKYLNLFRDTYLLFGITSKGELVSKWVDRWDLDSNDPVVEGCVIHKKRLSEVERIPQINQGFDPKLLSRPCPGLFMGR